MTSPFASLLAFTVQQPAPSSMDAAGGASGGPGWLLAVNLVIWTGLFLFLLRLERRLGGGRKENER
jgi:CcmD family protein